MDEAKVKALVEKQADDEGLWFEAQTCAEAYLQQQLRLLHAEIEGTDFFGRPALTSADGTMSNG
jgi:hypothetical protein